MTSDRTNNNTNTDGEQNTSNQTQAGQGAPMSGKEVLAHKLALLRGAGKGVSKGVSNRSNGSNGASANNPINNPTNNGASNPFSDSAPPSDSASWDESNHGFSTTRVIPAKGSPAKPINEQYPSSTQRTPAGVSYEQGFNQAPAGVKIADIAINNEAKLGAAAGAGALALKLAMQAAKKTSLSIPTSVGDSFRDASDGSDDSNGKRSTENTPALRRPMHFKQSTERVALIEGGCGAPKNYPKNEAWPSNDVPPGSMFTPEQWQLARRTPLELDAAKSDTDKFAVLEFQSEEGAWLERVPLCTITTKQVIVPIVAPTGAGAVSSMGAGPSVALAKGKAAGKAKVGVKPLTHVVTETLKTYPAEMGAVAQLISSAYANTLWIKAPAAMKFVASEDARVFIAGQEYYVVRARQDYLGERFTQDCHPYLGAALKLSLWDDAKTTALPEFFVAKEVNNAEKYEKHDAEKN
jgi:hypothetical protein